MLQCLSVTFRSTRIALIRAALAILVGGCATPPSKPPSPPSSPAIPAAPSPSPGAAPSSKYYSDDGPPLVVPGDLDAVPDAVPRARAVASLREPAVHGARPRLRAGDAAAAVPRAWRRVSWYGRKFHGQKTSIGEIYDMFAMTAAHPTLPLPSYARVTSVANGRSVVVRVNDRGPFLHGRIIDLSYAAAHTARHRPARQRRGDRRVDPSRRRGVPRSQAPLAAGRCVHAARPIRLRWWPTRCRRRRSRRASSCSSARSQTYANAQTFLAHVQNQTAAGAGRTAGATVAGTVARLRRPVSPTRRSTAGRRADRVAHSASRRRSASH